MILVDHFNSRNRVISTLSGEVVRERECDVYIHQYIMRKRACVRERERERQRERELEREKESAWKRVRDRERKRGTHGGRG